MKSPYTICESIGLIVIIISPAEVLFKLYYPDL